MKQIYYMGMKQKKSMYNIHISYFSSCENDECPLCICISIWKPPVHIRDRNPLVPISDMNRSVPIFEHDAEFIFFLFPDSTVCPQIYVEISNITILITFSLRNLLIDNSSWKSYISLMHKINSTMLCYIFDKVSFLIGWKIGFLLGAWISPCH